MSAIGWHRPTKAVINLQSIQENIKNEKKKLPENCQLFAVVKANAYGHGAVSVAHSAKKAGASGFCVALLDEGLELRNGGIDDPILLLNPIHPDYLKEALLQGFSVTVASLEWLNLAIHFMEKYSGTEVLKVHLKVDTGMGRIGFTEAVDILNAIKILKENDFFFFEGIYTHFATADEEETTYFTHQELEFIDILQQIPEFPPLIHVGNSATGLWHPNSFTTMLRYGIAMYGLDPSNGNLPLPFELQPALSLCTELIYVKQIKQGDSVGYGATYQAQQEEWIGTIPIGYADGWRRSLQGFHLIVDGMFCEIVGRICMDQCMIRLPKEYPVGTKVTLIGSDNGSSTTMQEIADYVGTIHYEIACNLSGRIPRIYEE